MTAKKDYTEGEWRTLTLAPAAVTTWIVTADVTVLGVVKEMWAAGRAPARLEPAEPARELVDAVLADGNARAAAGDDMALPRREGEKDTRAPARRALTEIGEVLERKSPPGEAAAFREWLLALAETVAEASRERAGKRVSAKESEALDELRVVLKA